MVYVINGAPIPLARPRFSIQNKRVYNPMRNQMLVASIDLQSQHNNKPLLNGPLHLDVTFYLPFPQRMSKKNKDCAVYVTTRPDLDNYIKFTLDISNGILFKDDAIVVSINAKKVYDDNPRTEFSIQSLTGEKSGKKI